MLYFILHLSEGQSREPGLALANAMSYYGSMSQPEAPLNTPPNLADFAGQFVVFFSDEKDPKVLFSSFIAEEAYKVAQDLKQKEGKEPVVFRVQENVKHNISQVLITRV